MAATAKLTEYERRRMENIRRNEELIASLKLESIATQLSSSSKRPRVDAKSYRAKLEKKPKPDTSVARRSLRHRGLPPEKAEGIGDRNNVLENMTSLDPEFDPNRRGAFSCGDAYCGVGSDKQLVETILGVAKKPQLDLEVETELEEEVELKDEEECVEFTLVGGVVCDLVGKKVESDFKVEDLILKKENIARVVPGKVLHMSFLPSSSLRMVVVGNNAGNIGLWNMDYNQEEGSGIYMYQTHSRPVSGISIHQDSISKIFSSCNYGFIRSMDAEKEVFDLVYESDGPIFSLAQKSDNAKCLYFGEGCGGISMWDERTGSITSKWTPHESMINSIDFNPGNANIITTSSSDRTACIWDLRCSDAKKLKSLKKIAHKRAVHSAYFSPSGKLLVTTR